MKQKDMLDGAFFSTTEESEMEQILKSFDSALSVIKTRTSEIEILSYIRDGEKTGDIEFSVSNKANESSPDIRTYTGSPTFYSANELKFMKGGASRAFLDELKSVGFAIRVGSRLYFCSRSVLSTLCTRADVGGAGFLRNSAMRDSFLANVLHSKDSPCNLIVRKSDDGVEKAYGLLGSAYAPIPQTTIISIANQSSESLDTKAKLVNFRADNSISRAFYEFPEIANDFEKIYKTPAKVIPGICISTSDIGDSSLIVWGTIRFEDAKSKTAFSPIFCGEFKRKHAGNIDIEKILSEINKSIFAEYKTIPERLIELLSINITDRNSALDYVSKKLKLSTVLGKDNENSLMENLKLELASVSTPTAYDIAMAIVSAPARVEGIADSCLLAFQKIAKDALWVDYAKINTGSTLYLTA